MLQLSLRIVWLATVYGLLAVVVAGMVIRRVGLIDRFLVFFPEWELVLTPGALGLAYEDVFFTASDGVRLHGWFVPGREATTWVWFHGNAGNIGHRVENIALLHRHLGANIFIFDYRGYGRSEGRATEEGTYLDAEAALAYLRSRQDVDPARLVLFGRSIGSAVAVEMAARHQVLAVVLESPFTSIPALAQRLYPYLPARLIALFMETRYNSLDKIRDVHAPLLVLHGDQDEIVPLDMGRQLFEGANGPKEFYAIPGAHHNDTYIVGGEAYFQALRAFVENVLQGRL